jgi:hypothetical protein
MGRKGGVERGRVGEERLTLRGMADVRVRERRVERMIEARILEIGCGGSGLRWRGWRIGFEMGLIGVVFLMMGFACRRGDGIDTNYCNIRWDGVLMP